MLLRNHGLLVTGRSVPEAFLRLWRLERACQIQVDAAAAGTLNVMGDNLAGKSGDDMDRFSEMESKAGVGDLEFAALIRKLDKTDPGWRH
jgi:ribulose-5-phosphate 4-epimerase/fuculose-1-phosphate aldolase